MRHDTRVLLTLKSVLSVSALASFLATCLSGAPLSLPPFVLGGGYCITASLPACNIQGITAFPYSASFPGIGQGSSVVFTANGVAAYGNVGASDSASLSDPTSSTQAVFILNAGFNDVLTITFGNLTGAGFMLVNATVHGVGSTTGSGNSLEAVGISEAGVGVVTNQSDFIINQTGVVSFPVALPFQYGVPFNFSFWLAAQTVVGYGNGTASANYLNTAALTGLHVFDSQMNPIANPVFMSQSGTIYTTSGVVPEPSMTFLTGLATILIVGVSRTACCKRVFIRFDWIQ
jgi:hypothetical protein